ncbi:MAG: F0F1 ATP synthase subunit A [Chloroflexi bacterium]|nr:F0F1 ATP synthase subunit A [Chloroflexota bacterium]
MTNERTAERAAPRSRRNLILAGIAGVVGLDVLAAIFVPPFPVGEPGQRISGIADLIGANLEFPSPNVVWDLAPNDPVGSTAIIFFHPSISAPLLTMWLVMAAILIVAFLSVRGMSLVPGRVQNAVEFAWESLENWAISLGGPGARKHIPLFAAFFLFILFSNWSGLLPFFGKIEALRAPTSDVNVTIGLALVVFVYFHFRGFQALGVRGYLGKFFVFTGFRHGIANGAVDLFVGLIEFLLEFIKPVTLAMRLFGNIFGGEVALGVITALTIAVLPAAMLLLEGLLNFVQALIFSTLMLMYTIIAVESHGEEAHAAPAFADDPQGIEGPPIASMQPASH